MDLVTPLIALLVGTGVGAAARPAIAAWLKNHATAHALATAKALIAKAESDAKALEIARQVVAAAPVVTLPPAPPKPAPAAS